MSASKDEDVMLMHLSEDIDTKILEWYDAGKYKPYAELYNGKILERVIIYLKTLKQINRNKKKQQL